MLKKKAPTLLKWFLPFAQWQQPSIFPTSHVEQTSANSHRQRRWLFHTCGANSNRNKGTGASACLLRGRAPVNFLVFCFNFVFNPLCVISFEILGGTLVSSEVSESLANCQSRRTEKHRLGTFLSCGKTEILYLMFSFPVIILRTKKLCAIVLEKPLLLNILKLFLKHREVMGDENWYFDYDLWMQFPPLYKIIFVLMGKAVFRNYRLLGWTCGAAPPPRVFGIFYNP